MKISIAYVGGFNFRRYKYACKREEWLIGPLSLWVNGADCRCGDCGQIICRCLDDSTWSKKQAESE